MAITKLPSNATLTDVANKTAEVKASIETSKNELVTILKDKDVSVQNTEKMSDLIKKVGTLSPPPPKLFGIRVNENVSDTYSRCTYIEDSVGMRFGNSTSLNSWADQFPYNKIRLVGFQNGKVTKEINIRDKSKYIDGEIVPSDVDVMVEIPKVYWNFTNVGSDEYEIRFSSKKFGNAECYAHKVNGVEKDHIYIGAYLASESGGKLRSVSDVMPINAKTISEFRTLAQANGSGYQLYDWYTHLLMQILYLMAYCDFNSQNSLGVGLTNGTITTTGSTSRKHTNGELVWGSIEDTQSICFLGLEDFYGNLYQAIDGAFFTIDWHLKVVSDKRDFNDSGENYIDLGLYKYPLGSDGFFITDGYFNKTLHTSKGGFFPINMDGASSTTYYGDYGYINNRSGFKVGGDKASSTKAGTFLLRYNNVDSKLSNTSTRLMYV